MKLRGSKESRRGRAGRPLGALAAGLAAAALLAACGGGSSGPGVASVGSKTTAGGDGSSTSGPTTPLEYARCMRSHGVSDFPDPDSSGQIQITASPGSDLAPDSPQWKAATGACGDLPPSGMSEQQQQQQYAGALKFAQCMREHGQQVSDPQPPGRGPQTHSSSGGAQTGQSGDGIAQGINPDSPQFKAAEEACRHFVPGSQGPSVSTQHEG